MTENYNLPRSTPYLYNGLQKPFIPMFFVPQPSTSEGTSLKFKVSVDLVLRLMRDPQPSDFRPSIYITAPKHRSHNRLSRPIRIESHSKYLQIFSQRYGSSVAMEH